MKGIIQTLVQVFAVSFYRNNATLFLLVLVIAGGFMRGSDHIMLAQYFVHSLSLLAIPAFVWIAYALFVAFFNDATTTRDENLFLRSFIFLSKRNQRVSCITVAVNQLIPVHAYGLFLLAVALKNGAFTSVAVIVLLLAAITILSSAWLLNCLRTPSFQKDIPFVWRWVTRNVRRPFLLFPFEWAFRSYPLPLAGYKLAGLAILWSTLHLYSTDTYDIRLAGIGVVFAFALNITFVLAIHRFLHGVFPIYMQMPFSIARRHTLVTGMLLLFSAPEFVLVIRHLPAYSGISDALLVAALGLAMNLLMFYFLYIRDRTAERVMPYLYFLVIALFIAVLARVPILLLVLFCFAGSVMLSWKYLYRFEYQAE